MDEGYKNIKLNKEKLSNLFNTPEYQDFRKKQRSKEKIVENIYQVTSIKGSGDITMKLIWANVIVFVLMLFWQIPILTYFAGFPLTSPSFLIWQPFTSMFLHGGFIHLLFNMLTLWSFSKPLEEMWAGKKFLFFYIFCGIASGLLCAALCDVPAVGASGAICGLLAAYSWIKPDEKVLLFFFIPMKIKSMTIGLGVISLVFGIASMIDPSYAGGIAHFGHLGGLLSGAGLMYFWKKKYLLTSTKIY